MARPREFDTDDALARAMDAFWQKGFDATSVQDLVAATGVQKASLYGAFGDKRQLFDRALERYEQRGIEHLQQALATGRSPLAAVRRLLRDTAARAAGPGGRRGCLCANTFVELAPHDPEVAAHMRRHTARAEAALARALRRAKAAGELPAGANTGKLATFLFAQILAIVVLGKTAPGAARLRTVADQAFAALSS